MTRIVAVDVTHQKYNDVRRSIRYFRRGSQGSFANSADEPFPIPLPAVPGDAKDALFEPGRNLLFARKRYPAPHFAEFGERFRAGRAGQEVRPRFGSVTGDITHPEAVSLQCSLPLPFQRNYF